MTKYIDVTAEITENTVTYPGDPKFSTRVLTSLDDTCFQLQEMTLCNHLGTHVDFPAHVIPDGKTSSDYDLNDLIMSALVVEIPIDAQSIIESLLPVADIHMVDCVLFKTRNSMISKQKAYTEDYVYLEVDAADTLIAAGVRAVGIDYLNVDGPHTDGLPVHHKLLACEVLVIENLELKAVTPGQYTIYIMTPKIPNMDGLPARVMLAQC